MFTRADVEKLAALARISVTEEEASALAKDIEAILSYVSEIKKIKGEASLEEPLANIMREDGEPHEAGLHSENLLREAPHRRGDYIQVKKIISK